MATDQINGTTILVNKRYADLDLNFFRNPNTNDITILKDALAVKRAVINLVLTQPGEAPFQPNLGSRVYRMLFDLPSSQLAYEIQEAIRETLSNFEPRVTVLGVDVQPTSDGGGYNVTITFTVINIQIPIVVTIYLSRTL